MKIRDYVFYVSIGLVTVLAVQKLEPVQGLRSINKTIVDKFKYKADFARAQMIYNKIIRHTGVRGNIPPLRLSKTRQVNAYVTIFSMYITQGMLDHVKSDSELAYVLGHEMGHSMLYHTSSPQSRKYTDSRVHEANADKISVYLLVRSGYDICNLGDVWTRLVDKYGASAADTGHPNMLYRAHQLSFPQCGSVKS